MNCDTCGTENLDWNSYCVKCGKSFGNNCFCRYVNRSGDTFCGGCGISLQFAKDPATSNKRLKEDENPIEYQFSKHQINAIKKDSVLLKISKEKDIEQSEIDTLFKDG